MITLEKNEQILFTARKHWFVFVGQVIGTLLLTLLPFVLLFLITKFGVEITTHIPGNAIYFIGTILTAWLTLMWIILFVAWTNYYLDMLMLTDKKVIEIEQRGLFSREVSTFGLERIQDITIDTNGLIPTLLNFGDLHIQTAGESREFILHAAANPADIKQRIVERQRLKIDDKIEI